MSEKLKKLVVIDGNAIIYRSFHALPPLTNWGVRLDMLK